MTKRRKFSANQKLAVVLEGLRGKPIGELCNEHQISQSMYYKWRDTLLTEDSRAFDGKKSDGQAYRLRRENDKLKNLLGELHLELKKSDWL